MPLSSRVRSPATRHRPPAAGEQLGAHQHLAAAGGRGDAGGPGDGRAEVVAVARRSPRRRGARCARSARSRARRDVARGPAGSRRRTRCRRRAAPKATKNPSPPCFTSSPRHRANSARKVRSCQRSSCSQASSPIASASRVDSTMSEKRKVRTARAAGSGRGGAMSRSTAAPISSAGAGGGLDLEAGAGVVAVGRQRPSQPHARLGGFVGGVDLAPGADALLQRGDGRLGVAAVERQLAARHRGRGRRSGRAEPSRQLLELGDALAGRRLVTDRQARGHVHRQHEDPALPREEARVGQRTRLRLRTARLRVALAPAASGPAPAGRRHRRRRPGRAPPRRRPGRRDGPGSPPARCSPSRRCSG